MMKKAIEAGFKFTASKEGRRQAKELFRKAFRKFKKQPKKERVPYPLIKADVKRSIAGTKLITKADIKANPGTRRRILLRIEKAKRSRTAGGKPQIFGKAYASDKAGKTMQIQPLTKQQRKLMLKEMADAADRGYKKVRFGKYGYNSGGDVKAIKTVATKLSKASKAHAGQSKVLKRIIKKYV